jgi:hypothetical protein
MTEESLKWGVKPVASEVSLGTEDAIPDEDAVEDHDEITDVKFEDSLEDKEEKKEKGGYFDARYNDLGSKSGPVQMTSAAAGAVWCCCCGAAGWALVAAAVS